MKSIQRLINESEERREQDRIRYEQHDSNRCMLCHAEGYDMRSLLIRCFYAVHEFVPEVIDLFLTGSDYKDFYYLRICKTCRGDLLTTLGAWAERRKSLRSVPKDSDGWPLEGREGAYIPVRIAGATVDMTREEYDAWRVQR